MRKFIGFSLLVLLALIITGCSSSSSLTKMEGEIYWSDGGVLPPDSMVSVQITNASLADATDILTQTTFKAEGPSPLNFFVEYAESAVNPGANYTANVRITAPDGTLLYVTKTAQFVIEQGQQVGRINILVEPV